MYEPYNDWEDYEDPLSYMEEEYNYLDSDCLYEQYPVAQSFLNTFGLPKNPAVPPNFTKMLKEHQARINKCKKVISDLLKHAANIDDYIEASVKEWFEEEKAEGKFKEFKDWEEFRDSKQYYANWEDESQLHWNMLWEDEYYSELFDAVKDAKQWEWRDEHEFKYKFNKYLTNLDKIEEEIKDFIDFIKHAMIYVAFNEVEE